MLLNTERPLYMLDDEHGVLRVSVHSLGRVDRLAEALGQQIAIRLPNVFGGRHIVKKNTDVYTSEQLTELRFNTYFTANGDHMVPQFSSGGDAVQAVLTWRVPDTMHLRFGVKVIQDGDLYVIERCIFAARSTRQTGFFRLPLPNIYADGRICMGNGWRPGALGLDAMLTEALRQFNNAPWNTDLMDGQLDNAQRLFRFSGTDTVPVDNWESLCNRVSHPSIEYVF